MQQHALPRVIWPLFAALILLPLGFVSPARPVAAAVDWPDAASTPLATRPEVESNDTISTAQDLGSTTSDWKQQVIGTISTSGDLDYYKFNLVQPASGVVISLENLPADYDIILAAAPSTSVEQGSSGVDDITNIGGQISAIGGQISAIGGQISAIGGQISAISANSGTTAEQIDTFLWQPGTYYVAVGAANGGYSATSSYTLNIQVKGSTLTKPTDAPTVEMRVPTPTYNGTNPITTLYVVNSTRMSQIYGNSTQVLSITTALFSLAQGGVSVGNGATEYGYVLDLANLLPTTRTGTTVSAIYDEWLANQDNPFYANKVARMIDNLIKAASDPARNGQSCPPNLPTAAPACPSATMYYDGGGSMNTTVPFPNVKYIVLVGGDNLIPFFRTPDLTTIANEADYAAYLKSLDSAGVINPSNPQGAALKYRMTLTDNPYGTDKPLRFQGFPLFLPNRAVGRLVESPEDILRYLDWQAYYGSYSIDLQSHSEGTPQAYVNGYDFLKDQATAVSGTLSVGLSGVITPTISGPINDTWRRADLVSSWFGSALAYVNPLTGQGVFNETVLNDPSSSHVNKLFSLNSHFDHWQILPAIGADTTDGTFLAERILKPNYVVGFTPGGYFGGTLGYSVGCHSGYNVIDDGIRLNSGSASLYAADFAQAFIRQAGNWIGNTGFGYGSADGIDYSERLSFYLTQELLRDVHMLDPQGTDTYVGAPIGTALAQAKQRYMRNVAGLSAYDAKSLTVMTLYGLPFIHVLVDNPQPPPPEEPQPGPSAELVPTQSNAPGSLTITDGRLERTITVTITPGSQVLLPRTGSKLLKLTEQNFSVTDSFVEAGFVTPTLRLIDNNQVGLPNLPAFAYDISALDKDGTDRLQVRDVVFESGEYALPITFNPQITQVVTETDSPIVNTSDEPSFAAGAGIWYPAKFFGFSSVGQGDEQRDQLISTAAQFKADTNGVTGQLRGYKKMVFKVYYIDPSAPNASAALADETAPTIQSVQIGGITPASAMAGTLAATTPGGVTVVAMVDKGDGTNIDGVSGVYVENGITWTPVIFENKSLPSDALQRWEAFIPLPPGQVRVIISATDAAGNVSYYTAKGTFSLGGSQTYLPLVRR
ncbi:peptidase [Chloroflexales bacterium ZM16-3]|nr:peptidase [Chloroflexales bacterium ZM16-3]